MNLSRPRDGCHPGVRSGGMAKRSANTVGWHGQAKRRHVCRKRIAAACHGSREAWTQPKELPGVDLAQHWSYFGHMPSAFKVKPTHKDSNKAVDEFKRRVPDLARGAWDESKAAPVAPSSTLEGPNLSSLRWTRCDKNPIFWT